jgi:hypothetical protein
MEQIIAKKDLDLSVCETIILIWNIIKKELKRGQDEQVLARFFPNELQLIANKYSILSIK